jgi:hypothetical protein
LLPFFCSTLACLWGLAQLGWLSAKAFDPPDIDRVPLWARTEKTRAGYLESFQVIGRCGRSGSGRLLVLCDEFALCKAGRRWPSLAVAGRRWPRAGRCPGCRLVVVAGLGSSK